MRVCARSSHVHVSVCVHVCLEQIFRCTIEQRLKAERGYLLDGVLYASDGKERGQVSRVGGDDDEGKHPPHPHHHPGGQGGVGHLSTWRISRTSGQVFKWEIENHTLNDKGETRHRCC